MKLIVCTILLPSIFFLLMLLYVGLFIIQILPINTSTTTSSQYIMSIGTNIDTYEYQKRKANWTSDGWDLPASDNITGKEQHYFQDVTGCDDLGKQHHTHHKHLTHRTNTVEWWVDVHLLKVLHHRRTSTKPTQYNHMCKVHNEHEKVVDKKGQHHTFNRKHTTKGHIVVERYTRKITNQAMCNKWNEQHTNYWCQNQQCNLDKVFTALSEQRGTANAYGKRLFANLTPVDITQVSLCALQPSVI